MKELEKSSRFIKTGVPALPIKSAWKRYWCKHPEVQNEPRAVDYMFSDIVYRQCVYCGQTLRLGKSRAFDMLLHSAGIKTF